MSNQNYKADEFTHFIQKRVRTRKIRNKDGVDKIIPEYERYEIPFEEIVKLDLNGSSKSIPYTIQNVVNLERYMLWYWSPIIGGECVILYLHLWEYCNKEENIDICYPKIDELCDKMKMSRPTLLNKIKILEENNFLIQIQRINKKYNKRQTSPLFKLRQTVPLLTVDQYNGLPEKIKSKHDEYMNKFAKGQIIQMKDHKINNSNSLLENSEILLTKESKKQINDVLEKEENMNILQKSLSSEQSELFTTTDSVQKTLTALSVSKPTIDLMYKDINLFLSNSNKTVYIIHGSLDILNLHLSKEYDWLEKSIENTVNEIYQSEIDDLSEFRLLHISLNNFINNILEES